MTKMSCFYVPVVAALLSPCHVSYGQSFSLDTTVKQTDRLYTYAFTLNYDQAGAVQTLTGPIYDWSFDVNPGTLTPTDIVTPTGWQYTYDRSSGQFDFFTQGPNGFGNGDFGPDVIQPGQSLSGFGLTTPAAPDLSIAFATDEQFNQDANTATLPTAAPVPEASTFVSFGALLLLGGICLAARKRARHTA